MLAGPFQFSPEHAGIGDFSEIRIAAKFAQGRSVVALETAPAQVANLSGPRKVVRWSEHWLVIGPEPVAAIWPECGFQSLPGNLAKGREFAAGDTDQAFIPAQGVFTVLTGGGFALTIRDHRPDTSPGGDHILGGQAGAGEQVFSHLQQVANLLVVNNRFLVQATRMVQVGGAEYRCAGPRKGKHRAFVLGMEQRHSTGYR